MLKNLIEGVVVRPVTTAMVTIAVLLFGLVGLGTLPVDLLPNLAYPTITVQTAYLDAAPVEIEELITRPIEERLSAVSGVLRVESISREGESEVTLDFAWGTSIDQAMADVREKLDRVGLPIEAERPLVLRYDPAQEPMLRLALRQSHATDVRTSDLARLRHTAEFQVKRELEKLGGVAAVELHGGEDDEVIVELDPARLLARQLTAADVVNALQRDNINRPGGAIEERGSRYLVRTLHEARTTDALADIIVRVQDGTELKIRDIGRVYRAPAEIEELSFVDGYPAVELSVFREGDANLVAASHAVLDELPLLSLPPGQEVVVLSNRAAFIESAIAEVQNNTLIGGVLAIVVLLFFLRDVQSTVVVAIAIPISLLATFIPLQALGVSLNVMSLGGLALGVGMLVDNSIVVLESIAKVADRSPPERAPAGIAVEGTKEVAASVVASTLTTVAVFLPISFLEGVAGQLVRDLSHAVSFSMISSMLVSLTVVPVLMSLGRTMLSDRGPEPTSAPRSGLTWVVVWPLAWIVRGLGMLIAMVAWLLATVATPLTRLWDRLEAAYPTLVRSALRRRWLVLFTGLAVCVYAMGLVARSERTLLPELDQDEFFVQVQLPREASIDRTTSALLAMSQAIADEPSVALRFTRVGSVTASDTAAGVTLGSHLGQIGIRLNVGSRGREAEAERLLARMLAANPEPRAAVTLGRPSLVSFAPPLEIMVYADELEWARVHVQDLLPRLQAIPHLVDVYPDDIYGRPEVHVDFDRARLGQVGATVEEAASAIQRAISGEVVTTMYTADDQLDVRVRFPADQRKRVDDARRLPIALVNGVTIPLSAVASVRRERGPSEVHRVNGQRGIRIHARSDTADLQRVAQAVEAVLDAHAPPDGRVQTEVAGQAGQLQGSTNSIAFVAGLSIFLVYVVMASSFESLLHPMLILFTVPLAVAGVVVALELVGLPISVMVGIGVIVLSGIVVNNAIVLINAINDRRGRDMPLDQAIVDAGQARVRPIVMTTATTVLGLIPMAIGAGDGAALRQPLAVAVIGGLLLSTLLTLLLIPCAYRIAPGPVRDAWKPSAE